MKKIGLVMVTLFAVGVLTGCAVTDEQRASCERQDGVVTSKTYPFKGTPGDFWSSKTGKLHSCNRGGKMIEVYNRQITELSGWASGNNATIFNECEALGGYTFNTRRSSGKTTSARYACIVNGEYRKILE